MKCWFSQLLISTYCYVEYVGNKYAAFVYDPNFRFIEKLSNHRRKLADSNSTAPASSIVVQTQYSFPLGNINRNDESKMVDQVISSSSAVAACHNNVVPTKVKNTKSKTNI